MYSKHLKQFSILGSRIYHSNVLLKQASSSSVLLSKNVSKGNSELSFYTQSCFMSNQSFKKDARKKRPIAGKFLLYGGAFALLSYQLLADLDKHKYLSKKKNLKMDSPIPDINVFGINIFPIIKKIFKLIPDETRKNLSIRMVSSTKIPWKTN